MGQTAGRLWHTPSRVTRRAALHAGSVGILGLGMAELAALRAVAAPAPVVPQRSVILIFLTGGISHQDSFDLKPEASDTVRGEFRPIATRTSGIDICEHLPLLAERSERYAIIRSVGTNSDGHEEACHALLTGRLDFPAGFNLNNVPSPNEWPSMAAQVTHATRGRNNLPPAVVLPQPSVNEAGKVRPGQYAGRLGPRHEAWHMDIAAPCALGNGACPNCFRFDGSPFHHESSTIFDTPMLTLPDGGPSRLNGRLGLLSQIESQLRRLEGAADFGNVDRYRQQAISVLAEPAVRRAFEVESASPEALQRYGKNKFGLSLLMAYRLVAAGVNLVQVNLGKNSSWDTHVQNFVNLKNNLLPYLDQSVSALLDDLTQSRLMDETLVIVTGEFGRTPKINKDAGRDHWGPVMSLLMAGAGVQGGRVIGATDNIAAQPIRDRYTPENLAATIYQTLGIPRQAQWTDFDGRPHELYRGEPISGLT